MKLSQDYFIDFIFDMKISVTINFYYYHERKHYLAMYGFYATLMLFTFTAETTLSYMLFSRNKIFWENPYFISL